MAGVYPTPGCDLHTGMDQVFHPHKLFSLPFMGVYLCLEEKAVRPLIPGVLCPIVMCSAIW